MKRAAALLDRLEGAKEVTRTFKPVFLFLRRVTFCQATWRPPGFQSGQPLHVSQAGGISINNVDFNPNGLFYEDDLESIKQ